MIISPLPPSNHNRHLTPPPPLLLSSHHNFYHYLTTITIEKHFSKKHFSSQTLKNILYE
jgi:hypothetical protein